MISFLRELAALPLKLLFWICHFLRLPAKRKLAEVIWKISRESFWVNTWIMLVCQQDGLDAARQLAGRLLDKYQDARIAHYIGTLELMIQKDPAATDRWIRAAESAGCQHLEELLYLKLLLADHIDSYRAEQIADQLMARNDMSMEYSRASRLIKAELWIRKGQWQKADDILDALLKVENMPSFYMYKWITSLALGRSKQAQESLSTAQKSLGGLQFLFYQALGWFYLGREDQAKALLQQAVHGGMDVRDVYLSAPHLAALISAPGNDPASGSTEGQE